MLDKMIARSRVNQAPLGTLVSAEDRYAPSRLPKTRKPKSTRIGLSSQTIKATIETMHVVMKVTRITHTP